MKLGRVCRSNFLHSIHCHLDKAKLSGLALAAFLLSVPAAWASCDQNAPISNATVTCANTTNQNNPAGWGTGSGNDNNAILVTTNDTLQGTTEGFFLGTGNSITVNSGATVQAVAPSALFTGILTTGGVTVINSGTVQGGLGIGVNALSGDVMVTNNNGATISATGAAVQAQSGNVTVMNSGTMSSTGAGSSTVSAGLGTANVTNNAGATISNSGSGGNAIAGGSVSVMNNGGTIQQTNGGAAIFVATGGTNNVTNSGTISASGTGSFGLNGFGDVTVMNNSGGTIQATGTGAVGVFNSGTGNTTYNNSGTISGTQNGANTNSTGSTTIINNGTISNLAASASPGAIRVNTATITNNAGGTISGLDVGILFRNGNTASTIFDAGTISGVAAAIQFSNTSTGNTLTVAPGFTITGNVTQGASNILQLGGSGGSGTFNVSNIPTQYATFTTFNKIDTSTWTLTGTDTRNWTLEDGLLNVTGSIGNVTVSGGNLFVSGSVGTGTTAVQFQPTATGSTLTVAPGFTINGTANGDNVGTFQLGGSSGSGTFNVSNIGAGQQYQNFIAFNKIDNSTWTLTGTDKTDAWTVQTGTLNVTGMIGNTTVQGGTLMGTGTVNNLQVNGGAIFAPGSGAPGTSMSVGGNLAFASGATYQVQVNPTTASFADVTGTAALNGTVNAVFAPGSYVTKQHTILESAGLGNTTFSGLTNTNLPIGITDNLSYMNGDVFLNLTAGFVTGGVNLNQNQQAVANAIDNFFNNGGALPPSFLSLFNLTGANLANALTALDGENATGAEKGAFDLMNEFLTLMFDAYVDGRAGGGAGGPLGFAPDQADSLPPDIALAYDAVLKAPPKATFAQRWTAWGSGFGGSATANGDPVSGSNTVTTGTFGYAAGMDYHYSPDTVLGFALAGGGTSWNLAQGLGTGRSDAFMAGLYGVTHQGPVYLAGSLAFANNWFTTNRTALGDQLTANFQGQSYAGRLEGGYRFALPAAHNAIGITPYAAIQAQNFHTPAYSETDLTSGGFGLSYAAMNGTDTRGELGGRFDDHTAINAMPLILRARLAWAHDWVSNPALNASFESLPGASFTVNGAPIPHDSALTSAGAQLFFTPSWSLLAKFDGEFAKGAQSYAGTGMLRYSW